MVVDSLEDCFIRQYVLVFENSEKLKHIALNSELWKWPLWPSVSDNEQVALVNLKQAKKLYWSCVKMSREIVGEMTVSCNVLTTEII